MTGDTRRESVRMALLVFVAALVMRIPVALWLPEQVVWPDGNRYERVALNLLEGKGFGDLVENRRSVPTQPLLIAGVYSVFGQSYVALRIVSAILGALSCVVAFLLGRQLFGVVAGVCAGLLLAAYPHLVYLSALFEYPQTLGILFLVTFLLLLYRFDDSRKLSTLFLASVVLGATILTLPTLLLFVPVFGLLALKRDASLRSNLGYALVAAAGLAITVGSWTLRNYIAYDHVVVVNAASGANFWAANNEAYARWGKRGSVPMCGGPYADTSYCLEFRETEADLQRRNLTRTEYVLAQERAAWEHGLRFVRESPSRFARLAVTKFLQLWSPWPDAVNTGAARGGDKRGAISALTYIPMLVLALAGLVMTARTHARKLIPVYLLIAVFVAPFTVFLPTMRYRLPIDCLLGIFAAVPLARLWRSAVDAIQRRTSNTRTLESARLS
ncbi:MAG TPA: glycosyltransferase family 39 protein [Steroidobacteraceae bacterium]|jgi:4-amino-4-deoxy-L-arabinose transferase-like glycosyltransferase|nr:glycosyltransferase family 39 protein [Steroidobacteraceae bacterium]